MKNKFNEDANSAQPDNEKRRNLIKAAAWSAPMVAAVSLPSHAQTSVCVFAGESNTQLQLFDEEPTAPYLIGNPGTTFVPDLGLGTVVSGGTYTIDHSIKGLPLDTNSDAVAPWMAAVEPSQLDNCDPTSTVECTFTYNFTLNSIADTGLGLNAPLAFNGSAVIAGALVFDQDVNIIGSTTIGANDSPADLIFDVGDTVTVVIAFSTTIANLPSYRFVFGSEWFGSRPLFGDKIFYTSTISNMSFFASL